jgi:hypothetical protein
MRKASFIAKGWFMSSRAVWLVAVALAACGHDASPILQPSPTPAASADPSAAAQYTTISGVVLRHAPDGVSPFGAASLWGWVQMATSGWRIGPIQTDGNGRYTFQVPLDSSLRVEVGSPYQPCVSTFAARSPGSRDVHVVTDSTQLGAHLPAELLTDFPLLSGVVFENTVDGRQPISGVRVEVDMLWGMGDVSATTLTDSDGRYILCGLSGNSPYIYASKAGYKLGDVGTVTLTATNTTYDIELRR